MTDVNRWFLENHDHLRELGIEIVDQGAGDVTLRLPHQDSLANPGGDVIQGGIIATLIDHAGGAALRTTLDEPRETGHGTTDMNVSYVRPATGDLTAEASVVRVGGSMGVVQVEVMTATDEGDVTAAVGRVSLYLDRP
jgi:uncharacterized protein (TIGR00369 family)